MLVKVATGKLSALDPLSRDQSQKRLPHSLAMTQGSLYGLQPEVEMETYKPFSKYILLKTPELIFNTLVSPG